MSNLYIIIINALLGILLLNLAGFARCIFECIIIFDNMTTKHGWSPFWSKDEFVAPKDTNHDSKISYLENAVPFNGGHIIKWLDIIGSVYGTTLAIILGYENLSGIYLTLYLGLIPILNIFIYNLSFELYFRKYKP